MWFPVTFERASQNFLERVMRVRENGGPDEPVSELITEDHM